MRVGVDVGGTNTDAVLMDGARVVAKAKTPTTPDVTGGVTAALRRVLAASGVAAADVAAVMIGTTRFTNAVVERRELQPTAVVRLGLPATAAVPPLVDWPPELRAAIGGRTYLCHGGHEFDGRPISPLDPDEIKRAGADIAARGIAAVAVSAVFSPVDPGMEEQAADLLRAEAPGLSVTLSHEIGRLGLLERENAATLNACLRDLARETVAAFRRAIAELGLAAPLFLAQNDGTLMDASFAERYPVLTFASGPTNSMRGAAFLSGRRDAIVVDVGGTTTDVGVLRHGFPREASVAVEVGGVRTNLRMPDLVSVGLGGGSLVRTDPLAIGPRSVGYRLTEDALVFGGGTLTATDVAVAAGVAEVGDVGRVRRLDPALVRAAMERIRGMAEEAVDRIKTSAEPVPVVVVGGGSVLLTGPLAGAAETVTPDHHEAANAVGAAIAQISGEVDRVYALGATTREAALEAAKAEAGERAIAAGAAPGTVGVVDVEDVPLAYLPGNATRIRVKAVGEWAPARA
ncbi:MAG: hydantoinase/oxoprolinase family protein [Chloroflexota bacterium]|nr:hydantoinase/oxoprolinase family protein [Chloroflexota bacterium]